MGTRGVLCIADVVIVKFGAASFTGWLELYVMPSWVVEDEAGKVIVGFGRGCGSDVLEEVYRKTGVIALAVRAASAKRAERVGLWGGCGK